MGETTIAIGPEPGSRKLALGVAAGVLVLMAAGGLIWRRYALPSWLEPLRDRYREELAMIDVGDGVDAAEAKAITSVYMNEYISACGGPLDPELVEGRWRSRMLVGYAGKLSDKFIEVDARSGAVSSPGKPSFPTFRAFSSDLFGGLARRRELDPE